MAVNMTIGWARRHKDLVELAEQLLLRGMRPPLVSTLTGLSHNCCVELRHDLLPGQRPPRASIPRSLDGRSFSTRRAREKGSFFVAPYLALCGSEAWRRINVHALISAYDLHRQACERLGWQPLPIDWTYVIARAATDPQQFVVHRCATCKAPFLPNSGSDHCPICLRLLRRKLDPQPVDSDALASG